jgi:hypothetical protein
MDDWKKRVEAATVKLTAKTGQGVLVPGGLVLTATHCIQWDGDGGMALGDHILEPIATKSGSTFRLSAWSADALSDMAALGEPDNQNFCDDCEAFEEWTENTAPVLISDDPFKVREPRPVYILTHLGEWVDATATRWSPYESGRIHIEAKKRIPGGTSGGPIVDSAGRLVGVVSTFSEDDESEGLNPVAYQALPRWIWSRISTDSQVEAPCEPRTIEVEVVTENRPPEIVNVEMSQISTDSEVVK